MEDKVQPWYPHRATNNDLVTRLKRRNIIQETSDKYTIQAESLP